VAYRMGIESTSLFVTGLTFFIIFVVITCIFFLIFVGVLHLMAKKGRQNEKFVELRRDWKVVLKGILYRIVLIGWTQIALLSLWEFTQRDSIACVILAVIILFSSLGLLGWGSYKVIKIAQASLAAHKNAAYLLFSEPMNLHRWGFLYIQFRAGAYFFIIPFLTYYFAKACLIAFGQPSGLAQACGLVVVEVIYLTAISWLRPFMDKRTNSFNIAIVAISLVNAILLVFFNNIKGVPALVVGVMGVVFFIVNAIFALVLMILVGISVGFAIFSKNPDSRYMPMRDDRASFIKSSTGLPTELDALGATARGDIKAYHNYKPTRDFDDDTSSQTSFMKQTPPAPTHGLPNSQGMPPTRPNMTATGEGASSPFLASAARSSADIARRPSPFTDGARSNSPRPYEGYSSQYGQGSGGGPSNNNYNAPMNRPYDPDSMWKRGVGYDR